jgi:lipid-A-disaccharide synthase
LSVRVLLSCGEPSGDLYAGALTRELCSLRPGTSVEGLGGPQFAAAGGRLIDDYRGLSATGLTEAIPKIPRSLAALGRLTSAARRQPPDVCVVIDFPDFNFRLAGRLRRLGVPIVYYIGPQFWAWRRGRLETMRTLADQVLVIFPFEKPLYEEAGLPVEFVGHPLVDLVDRSTDRAGFLARAGLAPDARTIGLLPGSRPNEVARILPDLLRAAALIRQRVSRTQFVVARAPALPDHLFRDATGIARVVAGETDAVLETADLALTASGTATVQAALHDTPMVIVYRVSRLTYRLGRRFVLVDTFGMVNLIAGRTIVPELIQDSFTPEAVADQAVQLLTDAARVAQIREGLGDVRRRLGGPGASRRAAEAILRVAAVRLPARRS